MGHENDVFCVERWLCSPSVAACDLFDLFWFGGLCTIGCSSVLDVLGIHLSLSLPTCRSRERSPVFGARGGADEDDTPRAVVSFQYMSFFWFHALGKKTLFVLDVELSV